ncbi:MAG: malate synthase A [Kineosporiaceae bacterium]
MTIHDQQAPTIEVLGPMRPRFEEILTPEALEFVAYLESTFGARRCELLAARDRRRAEIAAGADLGFLPETAHVRDDPGWRVAPAAPGLVDRRVEMTGPTDRKMAINALNSGAKVWLADQEDATSPTWDNVVGGQLSLLDATRGTLTFDSPDGRHYSVTAAEPPTIVVRPRGWHLPEAHLRLGGRTVTGALVDFGLYAFHCAQGQIDGGRGPYFYLPKLESHLEARLWNDVFVAAQDRLGIPQGTIRATVLIETLPAAFEMEEILYELRDHMAGLNAGRWDYIFSAIKYYSSRGPQFQLPDRGAVTMTAPFMRAYTELLVATCHKRGAHAIGGMAAAVPDRTDEARTRAALDKIRTDKQREAGDGFDGSWVAHPAMVSTCREVFDEVLGYRPNQVERRREEVSVTAEQLLALAETPGSVTEGGLRQNVDVGLHYVRHWLAGRGAVALHGLMEDAATAEISRTQVWQWVRNSAALEGGGTVTADRVRKLIADVRDEALAAEADPLVDAAAGVMAELMLGEDLPDFLTSIAYARHLLAPGAQLPAGDLTGCGTT